MLNYVEPPANLSVFYLRINKRVLHMCGVSKQHCVVGGPTQPVLLTYMPVQPILLRCDLFLPGTVVPSCFALILDGGPCIIRTL